MCNRRNIRRLPGTVSASADGTAFAKARLFNCGLGMTVDIADFVTLGPTNQKNVRLAATDQLMRLSRSAGGEGRYRIAPCIADRHRQSARQEFRNPVFPFSRDSIPKLLWPFRLVRHHLRRAGYRARSVPCVPNRCISRIRRVKVASRMSLPTSALLFEKGAFISFAL